MKNINEYANLAVRIGEEEGEIIDTLGTKYLKIQFFDYNKGEVIISIDDIDQYLIEQ